GTGGQPDLEHPARPVRVGVDETGVVFQIAVDVGDLAVNGRVQVADGLGRLDLPARLLGDDAGTLGGQRYVDHVAQRPRGEVGDADRRGRAVNGYPFMLCGVAQLGRNAHARDLL